MGLMEGGCVVELRGVATLVGEVSNNEVGGVSLLQGKAELRGVAEVVEGTKDLVLMLRTGLPAAGMDDKVEVGRRSAVLLEGEAGMVWRVVSIGVDFVRGAEAREGVLVIGVVVCESGVEP